MARSENTFVAILCCVVFHPFLPRSFRITVTSGDADAHPEAAPAYQEE